MDMQTWIRMRKHLQYIYIHTQSTAIENYRLTNDYAHVIIAKRD